MALLIDLSVIVALILGFRQFREPQRAKAGNWLAAGALSVAVVLILYRHGVMDPLTVAAAALIGAIAGYALARVITMIQIPAMVAFQHGMGGIAAFVVALVELTRPAAASLSFAAEISGLLGLIVGSLTFSGSMIASAKLANRMQQAPQILPFHRLLVGGTCLLLGMIGTASFFVPLDSAWVFYLGAILLGATLGFFVAIRIGGADMPVLISSLNATAGLAAALCGMLIENRLLIAFGATVAASGSILTHVMCTAMNRSLRQVVFPRYGARRHAGQPDASVPRRRDEAVSGEDSTPETLLAAATAAIVAAESVVIVPGYGMALAKAQTVLTDLANHLLAMGKQVRYAIHPVAGRMPGHMNVLLAEAGVEYELLVDIDVINPELRQTDVVLVVGACDVVNPAAIDVAGTPIAGMPVLLVHEAKTVICCNFDRKPGYSGVENPLYNLANTLFLEGDAAQSIGLLHQAVKEAVQPQESSTQPASQEGAIDEAIGVLRSASSVVIIPGYGMALAKAQFKLVELAALLERQGIQVKYAIHPVAGRMPGHMNVLLAEAEVSYDDLVEMDDINPLFAQTDAVLVVGACDVVNPAAMESEGTPISGMPVLRAGEARRVIVCNYDTAPGYSGVPNSLYRRDRTIMALGDAGETLSRLLAGLKTSEHPGQHQVRTDG